MDYKKEILNIIRSKTKKSFDENTIIRDLDLDSIDMIEMITELEEKFKIEIPSDKIANIKTIRDVIELVDKIIK